MEQLIHLEDLVSSQPHKPTLLLTCGLPGSGKSSWLADCYDGDMIVSSDSIRKEYFGDEEDQEHNAQVFAIAEDLVGEALANQQDVALDATSLSPALRSKWIKIARSNGARVECAFFDTPIEVCFERNEMRTRQVPRHVIEHMNMVLVPPTEEEGFDFVGKVWTC